MYALIALQVLIIIGAMTMLPGYSGHWGAVQSVESPAVCSVLCPGPGIAPAAVNSSDSRKLTTETNIQHGGFLYLVLKAGLKSCSTLQ